MSQILSQYLGQHMRMEQKLTPQLIQSMSILQKPLSDLEAFLEEAVESNAALEWEEREASAEAVTDAARKLEATPSPDSEDGGFARLDRFARDYREGEVDWAESRPVRRYGGDDERDGKMAALANTAQRDATLQEHLLQQWSLLDDLSPELRAAGDQIINHLDDDGYLRVRLDEIAAKSRPPASTAVLAEALERTQELEPAGVGARDLVECLLLQLDALPGDNTIERELVEHHLHDIAHNRLPAISKATGFSLGEITEAMKAIRSSLVMHPGHLVGNRSVPPIRPDVIVEYAETAGGITVRLARGNMPKLQINPEVAALVRSKENGKETRDFARKQVDEAAALIDAVQFRRSRLMDVAQAIIERQRDFFDIGPQGLKVLRMSDLATQLNCDPSTISRTVADKYMQTPRGIYPLRYFFTGGTESAEGESVGWDRVKTRVKEIVDAEDKKNPLNDDQIVDILVKEGIEISRRTVAKYRSQLNIPAGKQRRQF